MMGMLHERNLPTQLNTSLAAYCASSCVATYGYRTVGCQAFVMRQAWETSDPFTVALIAVA